MTYTIVDTGSSRSFPAAHAFTAGAASDGNVVIIIGTNPGSVLASLREKKKSAVLVELGTECLGVHTGESRGDEGSNVLGFARFRLGDAPPSNLVELVKQPKTDSAALAAAKQVFESAGLAVAVCNDFPGRIVDRLIRPYLNAALRRLDEGLASADDMDTTLRLGLGYPEGPIALLERTGLAAHFDVTQSLYEALGESAYAPARRARVARMRQGRT
jgi:3-hydroxybutyryl-CoA dehydrogenase